MKLKQRGRAVIQETPGVTMEKVHCGQVDLLVLPASLLCVPACLPASLTAYLCTAMFQVSSRGRVALGEAASRPSCLFTHEGGASFPPLTAHEACAQEIWFLNWTGGEKKSFLLTFSLSLFDSGSWICQVLSVKISTWLTTWVKLSQSCVKYCAVRPDAWPGSSVRLR